LNDILDEVAELYPARRNLRAARNRKKPRRSKSE
jgi:hypothetical protein